MRSVRLDPDLDRRVTRAAEARGESVSEFLRRAAAERADQTLDGTLRERLERVIGAVHSKGGRARRTGTTFREILGHRQHDRG